MKQKQISKILFLSIMFMFLFSISFLIMPIASQKSFEGKPILLILNGIWFWLTGIISLILFMIANKRRKKQIQDISNIENNKPGILQFFSNIWAKVADCLFLLSLIGLIIFIIILPQSYFLFVFAFFSVFTFLMHCVLNGKNFKYIINSNQGKSDIKEESE